MNFDVNFSWDMLYAFFALGMSIFYGLYACIVFDVINYKCRAWQWRFHQFWFNFLGAAIGWVAAWSILGSVLKCLDGNCTNSITPSSVLLFFLAFIGVTGHLPMSVMGLVGGLREFVAKLLSVISGKS
jgi:hypothetical protein